MKRSLDDVDAPETKDGDPKRPRLVTCMLLAVRGSWLAFRPVGDWFPTVADDDEDEEDEDDDSEVASSSASSAGAVASDASDASYEAPSHSGADEDSTGTLSPLPPAKDRRPIDGAEETDEVDPDAIPIMGAVEITWTTRDPDVVPHAAKTGTVAERWAALWTAIGPRPPHIPRHATSWTSDVNGGKTTIKVAWHNAKWLSERAFTNYD